MSTRLTRCRICSHPRSKYRTANQLSLTLVIEQVFAYDWEADPNILKLSVEPRSTEIVRKRPWIPIQPWTMNDAR
jgi:hypothetical protein